MPSTVNTDITVAVVIDVQLSVRLARGRKE
jgi:hypothetical protein